MRRLRRA